MSLVLLRREKGLTTVQVAERLNISQGHYSHIENGDRSINDETAQRLAELFGTDVDEIRQKSKEQMELRGTLRHWLSPVKYRGELLVDVIVKELKYEKSVNLEDREKLIYIIAGKVSEKIREEIIWNFKENPDHLEYFIKRLKE